MRIESGLRALIVATLLPVAVAGIAGGHWLIEKERATFERGVRDRARALVDALDADLRASIAPLQLLAASPRLAAGNLRSFRDEAEMALRARRDAWSNIMVSDGRTAEMLLNLLAPAGAPLHSPRDPQAVLKTAGRKRPTISNVVMEPLQNERPLFAIRLPVTSGDEVRHVLSAVVDAGAVLRLIERQKLPRSWQAAVVDGNFRFVARVPDPGLDRPFASESLKQALRESAAAQGWQRGRLLDGSEIYRAIARSSLSDWSVSIAVPRKVVDESLYGLWILIAAVAAAAGLGLWLAWWLAGRIAAPLSALADAVPAIGRGEAVRLPDTRGAALEVQALSTGLNHAVRAIQERDARQKDIENSLRASDRAKDQFISMLGHELRNPLAGIANATHLLRLKPDDRRVVDEATGVLGRQVPLMSRLVNDLLDVGRLTGGKVSLELAPLDLADMVGTLVKAWRSEGRFARHSLDTSLQPAWINGDRGRLEQVVSNLLENAIKCTPPGGRIVVRTAVEGASGTLTIEDTGKGISTDLLARVFDLFVQGERKFAGQSGGLGVGLTIAREVVELHGGRISAASPGEGRGSVFRVEIPT